MYPTNFWLYKALARAIYSRAPILALDDTLSAVDTTTAAAILDRLFGQNGILQSSNVTVIMVTSLRELLYFVKQKKD